MISIEDRDIEDFDSGEDAKIDIFRPYVDLVRYAFGSSPEVAAACVYLASDEAAYVTGQTLHVNGGLAMI